MDYMKKRHILAIIVIIFMVYPALTACGHNNSDTPQIDEIISPEMTENDIIPSTNDDTDDEFSAGDDSGRIIGHDGSSSEPSIGETIVFGEIEWLVLDLREGDILIISKDTIDHKPFNRTYEYTSWERSSLRRYLNNDFYNGFSQIERERIVEMQINTERNPWYGTTGGTDSTDKVFLLSLQELIQYFGSSDILASEENSVSSIFTDEYNNVRISYDSSGDTSWWWLRTLGHHRYYAAAVNQDGSISVGGNVIYNERGGVRPALWLSMS